MLDCVERHSPGSESFEVLRQFSLPMRRGITAVRGCTDPRVLRVLELYWVLVHCNLERVDLYFPCFSVSCLRSGVTRLLTVGLHIYIMCFSVCDISWDQSLCRICFRFVDFLFWKMGHGKCR